MPGTLFEETVGADTAGPDFGWQDPFRTWVERNKKWTRPVGLDWTIGQIGADAYGSQQDWWQDPLAYQWGTDTSQEVTDWRVSNPLLSERKQDVIGLLAEWAGFGGGTDPIDTTPPLPTGDDGLPITAGTVNPDDPTQIWVGPIDGFDGGYYKPGDTFPINGVFFVVQADGTLKGAMAGDELVEGRPLPEAVEIPTFEEFLAGLEEHGFTWDLEGTDAYADWQSLTDLLAEGVRPEDTDASWQHAYLTGARARGYETVGEYLGWLHEQENLTMDDMYGLGDEQIRMRDRFNRTIVREQEERMMRAMSTHRAGGGTLGQNFAQMDQFNQQIRDTQIQAANQMIQDDYQARLTEFEREEARYDQAVENGEMTASEYMQMLSDNRAKALGEYSKQLDMLLKQNMQYLQMYAGEFDALVGGFDMAYKIANLAMAMTDQDMAIAQQAWDQFMQSAAWQEYLAGIESEDEEAAVNSFIQIIGMILGFAGTVL